MLHTFIHFFHTMVCLKLTNSDQVVTVCSAGIYHIGPYAETLPAVYDGLSVGERIIFCQTGLQL